MLQIGIIGVGFMGMTHFEATKKVNGARVAAISTRSEKKLAGDWSDIQGNFGPRGSNQTDLTGIGKYRDHRDLLGNALEAYLSAVAQRTNEIVKALTIMSAVFLPLAFLVGFFGQNFDNLPFLQAWVHSDRLMWGMILVCLAMPVGLVVWFRRKGWL